MDFNDVLYWLNGASPYIYTGSAIAGAWFGLGVIEALKLERGKKLVKRVESLESEFLETEPGRYALVINGRPNRSEKESVIKTNQRYGKAIGKLLRLNGYNVNGKNARGEKDTYLKEFLGKYGDTANKIVVYFNGHGNHESSTNFPTPDETVKLLNEFENTDVELVIDSCGSGSYVEAAKNLKPKNLKVYTSAGKGGSFGTLTSKIIKKAKKRKWRFDSMGEIMPKRTLDPLFKIFYIPASLPKYVKESLSGKRPYLPTSKVQKYSPAL